MAERITIDDALPSTQQGPAGRITFDEAMRTREANTHTYVDVERLRGAQAAAQNYPDPRNLENSRYGDTSVPIEPFVRIERPPIQPAERVNFGASLKGNLVENRDTRMRLIAESLFPGDPEGVRRVGEVDGKPVYVDDDGQLRFVSSWAGRTAASVLGNAPEMVGAVAGSMSASPVGGSTLGAMGARGIKRAVAGVLFDEPQTVGGNIGDVVTEGVVNLGSGLVGKGVAAFAGRAKVLDFTPRDVKTAEQARAYIRQATGIDVDLAQASGNNKLIALRAYAARFPGRSAELVQAFEEAQKGQLDGAVTRVLDQVAKAAPSEIAGGRGINAATAVIDLAKAKRDAAVREYYEAARRVTVSADVVEAFNKDPALRYFAGKVQRSPLYQRDLQGARPDSVGFWHYVQQEIDDEIAKSAKEPNKVRILTQARREMNRKLEAASPEFAQANAYYAQQTREIVEPLEQSAVGVIARVTSPKAATVAARIFNDPNISTAEIKAVRTSIEQHDPEAWNGLVRQWLGQSWNKALRETQTGGVSNPAGKLRQFVFGTPEMRQKAAAMMPAGAMQAFNDLMIAAQAMARTPSAGSNTMRDLQIAGQLKGQGAVVFKWLTSPRAAITNAAEQSALERNTLAITEAILDPAKQKQLRQVVKMQDSTRKAIVLASVLSGQAAQEAFAPGVDHMPSWPTQPGQRTAR